MRIYFIHVYRRRWEFFPVVSPREPDPLEVEEKKSGFLHWVQGKASNVWESIEGARSGMLGRVRSIIETLNSRVDPTEPMLRHMRSAETVEVVYPSDISERFARRRLRLLLVNKTAAHKRWLVLNSLMLPLTMAATIIPGPNVFLFWNAYRLLSHTLASRGAQRILSGEVRVVYTPSDELNEVTAPERHLSEPLDVAGAEHIAERLKLPGLVDYLRKTGGLAGDEEPGASLVAAESASER